MSSDGALDTLLVLFHDNRGKVVKVKLHFEFYPPGWFFLRNLLVVINLWNLDYALEFSPDAEPATDHAALARLETD